MKFLAAFLALLPFTLSADSPLITALLKESSASPKNTTTSSSTLFYDQRQTGKYNINVNIKDVAFISLEPDNLSSNIGVSFAASAQKYILKIKLLPIQSF